MNTVTMANPNPALMPDRDTAYRLQGVYEVVIDGCRDQLVLAFDGASLTFRADPDLDTLESRFESSNFQPTAEHRPLTSPVFTRFVGAEFGWSWLAWNQQGYCDSALLSFGGITPGIVIHVIASSIRVYGISAAAA